MLRSNDRLFCPTEHLKKVENSNNENKKEKEKKRGEREKETERKEKREGGEREKGKGESTSYAAVKVSFTKALISGISFTYNFINILHSLDPPTALPLFSIFCILHTILRGIILIMEKVCSLSSLSFFTNGLNTKKSDFIKKKKKKRNK